ncbi:DegT/DnrJ/EryC1/StrS aminotransferase family protein [Psychrobacillus sp. NEAU-3TGS]|uniref:DegT/DnrJ/EryC1/StrS family aminotransferase n=1 Tax=Psychrobacillus sp. NEAU-3TGS TaxID=2995412 RepID=UPI002496424E|nr:DegT/DnrJ/EryC1/StrS aminotransferase family protein [Psychrobacillus sp. NEAU-3TGS]MDI2589751.1 DegT/DnrJ/EryC1/StrS aminotransferase family protein [Psychrobacillus sp. NEAU-3TGS]
MIKLSQPIISEEEIQAVSDVLRTGMLVQGQYVADFEQALKKYMGAQNVLAVSSGTSALHLALAALEIGEGDAVFVPGFTYPATVNVLEIQKAKPILIDVDASTYNIDPDKLEETIINYSGKETPKAIMVVHEFGAPAEMTRILDIAKRYNLFVVEDAACALGTTINGQHVGTFGDIGCFSWHPRKAITTGEGGAVVTQNEKLNKRISLLRNHGLERLEDGSMDFVLPGFNYRLTEFQAVLGIHQLKKFNKWIQKRNELVEYYYKFLRECPHIQLPKKIEGHAWQTFMVVLEDIIDRGNVIHSLKLEGIETNLGAQAIGELTYYRKKYDFENLSQHTASNLYKQGLALPLSPLLDKDDIRFITTKLMNILKANE